MRLSALFAVFVGVIGTVVAGMYFSVADGVSKCMWD